MKGALQFLEQWNLEMADSDGLWLSRGPKNRQIQSWTIIEVFTDSEGEMTNKSFVMRSADDACPYLIITQVCAVSKLGYWPARDLDGLAGQ